MIIDESSQYPQFINFQTVQDKTAMLDGLNAGDEIEVNFNLRGREWTSPQNEVKYFNSLDAWKISRVDNVRPAAQAAPQGMANTAAPAATSAAPTPPLPETEDDLPF